MKLNQRAICAPIVLAAAVVTVGGFNLSALGQCGYEVTEIILGPDCGYQLGHAAAMDLNDEGHIAGFFICPAAHERPFIWTPESGLEKISLPPDAWHGRAYAINNSDQVVGYMAITGAGYSAFLWDAGELTLLPAGDGGEYCGAYGINNASQAVGFRDYDERLGMLWEGDIVIDIVPTYGPSALVNDVNEAGQATGWMGPGVTTARAFLWDGNETLSLDLLPDAQMAEGEAINNLGQIAGYSLVDPPNEPESISGSSICIYHGR